MKWKYYPEPFNRSKPPPAPPNRTVRMAGLFSGGETKESKQRTAE